MKDGIELWVAGADARQLWRSFALRELEPR
jgi:hypothetical protein